MTSSLKRVVIVTGASRGLGKALALAFGKAGDRVVVNFLSNEGKAREVADLIVKAGGEAVTCRADVKSRTDVEAMFRGTINRWGRVDVLINNAGITRDSVMLRMPENDWDEVLGTNLKGVFLCIQTAARSMTEQNSGHIVNIASITALQGREGQASYTAAKAGVIGLTRTAAREFGPFNIKINAVLPGYMATDMGETVQRNIIERVFRENLLGRISDPEEVALFILHLSRMDNVSGQVFNLDSRII